MGLKESGGKSSSIPWLESLPGILPYFRTTFLFKYTSQRLIYVLTAQPLQIMQINFHPSKGTFKKSIYLQVKLLFYTTHLLLYRGQIWFLSMKTLLSSPLALPPEWMWTRGTQLPTVLDNGCLNEDSRLMHISPRGDHIALTPTPKSQRSNPRSWSPQLPSNTGMAWYPDPHCLTLSALHYHLQNARIKVWSNGGFTRMIEIGRLT